MSVSSSEKGERRCRFEEAVLCGGWFVIRLIISLASLARNFHTNFSALAPFVLGPLPAEQKSNTGTHQPSSRESRGPRPPECGVTDAWGILELELSESSARPSPRLG